MIRRKPLQRGGPLKRTEFKRQPPARQPRGKPKPTPRSPDPVTPEVRAEVMLRDGGCVMRRYQPEHRCGGRLDPHHRKLRRHGDHSAVNLVTLCRVAHDFVHQHVAWSYDNGLLVHGWDEVRPL